MPCFAPDPGPIQIRRNSQVRQWTSTWPPFCLGDNWVHSPNALMDQACMRDAHMASVGYPPCRALPVLRFNQTLRSSGSTYTSAETTLRVRRPLDVKKNLVKNCCAHCMIRAQTAHLKRTWREFAVSAVRVSPWEATFLCRAHDTCRQSGQNGANCHVYHSMRAHVPLVARVLPFFAARKLSSAGLSWMS